MTQTTQKHAEEKQKNQQSAQLKSQSKGAVLSDHRESKTAAVVQQKPNSTGLPDKLKSGMESHAGMNLDHVQVHYNSSKPAKVQAHAFAQGSQIHLGPGQEHHLPHELGHVVQQAQGRVKPTTKVNGVNVNDNASLEHEATAMGNKALQRAENLGQTRVINGPPLQAKRLGKDNTAQFSGIDGLGMEGINYSVMSRKAYKKWQHSDQATAQLHGKCEYGNQVVVSQFQGKNPYVPDNVQQHAGLSHKVKGGLVIAEGVLTLGAGVAVLLATHGAGLVPGITAIGVGLSKIVRGIITYKSGPTPSAKAKVVMDALRMFEAALSIFSAAKGKSIAGLVFGVAKAMRSVLMAITDYMGNDTGHPRIRKVLTKIAAALHAVEVGAGYASGISGLASGTTSKMISGGAGVAVATSKAVRAGDQNYKAWKKPAPAPQGHPAGEQIEMAVLGHPAAAPAANPLAQPLRPRANTI